MRRFLSNYFDLLLILLILILIFLNDQLFNILIGLNVDSTLGLLTSESTVDQYDVDVT